MPAQVESPPHLHLPSRPSASASAEERRLHQHLPTSADERSSSSADVCRPAPSERAGGYRELPPWEVLELLEPFVARYPSTKFENLWLFQQHVVLVARRRFTEMNSRDPEEWTNRAFSSALIFAARRALGEIPRGCLDPMGHFIWALGKSPPGRLQHGSTANFDELRGLLEELGVGLEQLLRAPSEPSRKRGMAAAGVVASALSVGGPSSGETRPPEVQRGVHAPAIASDRSGFEPERLRRAAITEFLERMTDADRLLIDRCAEELARAELGPDASPLRVGPLRADKRNTIVEGLMRTASAPGSGT